MAYYTSSFVLTILESSGFESLWLLLGWIVHGKWFTDCSCLDSTRILCTSLVERMSRRFSLYFRPSLLWTTYDLGESCLYRTFAGTHLPSISISIISSGWSGGSSFPLCAFISSSVWWECADTHPTLEVWEVALLWEECQVFSLRPIMLALVRSVLEYGCIVSHYSLSNSLSGKIERIQKRCFSWIIHPNLHYHDALNNYLMVSVFGWPDPNTRECCES